MVQTRAEEISKSWRDPRDACAWPPFLPLISLWCLCQDFGVLQEGKTATQPPHPSTMHLADPPKWIHGPNICQVLLVSYLILFPILLLTSLQSLKDPPLCSGYPGPHFSSLILFRFVQHLGCTHAPSHLRAFPPAICPPRRLFFPLLCHLAASLLSHLGSEPTANPWVPTISWCPHWTLNMNWCM